MANKKVLPVMSVLECPSCPPKAVRVTLSDPLLEGINFPVVITSAVLPGSHRQSQFVATQTGQIYRLHKGKSEIWLDISDRIIQLGSGPCPRTSPFDERGLLALAFHERFTENGLFYLYYSTRDVGPQCPPFVLPNPCEPATLEQRWVDREQFYDHINALEEWKVSRSGEIRMKRTLLRLRLPAVGGNGVNNVRYSPSTRTLLLFTGDGTDIFDVFGLAQNENELLGKVISIDVDRSKGVAFSGQAVSRLDEIPAQLVPFVTLLGKGLRVPVGQLEECHNGNTIYYVAQGGEFASESVFAFEGFCQPTSRKTSELVNFGWRGWEGNIPTSTSVPCPDGGEQIAMLYYDDMVRASALRINPIINYYHNEAREGKPDSTSITSLALYKGEAIRGLRNSLVFSDFGTVRGVDESGRPIITGFLAYSKPCRSRLDKTQDFQVIDVEFDFPAETFVYTTLGEDLERRRLFLGVGFTVNNVANPNSAAVYEILPLFEE